MKRLSKIALLILFVAVAGGVFYMVLGDYNITSNQTVVSDVFRGKLSVLGNQNDITIKSGSRVDVITLLGSDNIIRVEPGARVAQIRGGGANNRIIAPPEMDIENRLFQGKGVVLEGEQNSEAAAPPRRPLDGL